MPLASTIDAQTQLVGIIGWPITHSLSPMMHNAAFAHLGLNWRYVPLPVREADIGMALRGLAALGFRGVNITVPHKTSVMPYLSSITDAAQTVGAVNTIRVDRSNGQLTGLNTDMSGFLTDLAVNGVSISSGTRVVILGAGGAARACAAGLVRSGANVTLVNRTFERSQEVVEFLRKGWPKSTVSAVSVDWLHDVLADCKLIVNTTSVGLWPETKASPWPAGVSFPPNVTLYDTVYRPLQTQLMRDAAQAGARVIGGIGMLVYQGAAAFEAWTGKPAPIAVMRQVAEAALSGS